jgi:farnesyl-diphosphate farnesyltransferase
MGLLGDILAHPDELMPLLRMREAAKKAAQLPSDPSVAFCYDMLLTVSRR